MTSKKNKDDKTVQYVKYTMSLLGFLGLFIATWLTRMPLWLKVLITSLMLILWGFSIPKEEKDDKDNKRNR